MQGDQIGRIFAFWAIVYFDSFLKIFSKQKWFAIFMHSKMYALVLAKNGFSSQKFGPSIFKNLLVCIPGFYIWD
jgi:hypothetical protein